MPDLDNPRLLAGYEFLRRSGAASVQLRYSDDDEPTVWVAVVEYNTVDGVPVPYNQPGEQRYVVAADLEPLGAVLRLCERVGDGGKCTHCHRPTGFEPYDLGTMPLDEHVCWYQYDPGAAKYIRACAGG